MRESIVVAVAFTALTTILAISGVIEMQAFAVFVGIITFYAWCAVAGRLDKSSKRKFKVN